MNGGPVAAGCRAWVKAMLRAGVRATVFPLPTMQNLHGRRESTERWSRSRWLERVTGKPYGVQSMVRGWKAWRPQDWPAKLKPKRAYRRKPKAQAEPVAQAPAIEQGMAQLIADRGELLQAPCDWPDGESMTTCEVCGGGPAVAVIDDPMTGKGKAVRVCAACADAVMGEP